MKSDEVCKMFNVSKATLKSFENAGLFDDINVVDGDINYSDDDIERLSMIISLKKIGLKKDMIADFINSKNKNNQLSILKKTTTNYFRQYSFSTKKFRYHRFSYLSINKK